MTVLGTFLAICMVLITLDIHEDLHTGYDFLDDSSIYDRRDGQHY